MTFRLSRAGITATALATLLLTTGCIVPNTEEKREQLAETHDPLEPLNRYFFDINIFLLEFVLKPASAMYQAALPDPAQNGVHKFLANLHLPWTAVNDVFQGNPRRAGVALTRFAINTTLGGAGFFDVATDWGFPDHSEDFGQTLAVWGVPEMFYLVLPIFGPSNPRDGVGLAFDYYLDPVNVAVTNYVPIPGYSHYRDPHHSTYTWFPTARGVLEGVDQTARNRQAIDDLQKQSMDFYATVRSIWRQRRAAEIKNQGEDDSTHTPVTMVPAPASAAQAAAPAAAETAGPIPSLVRRAGFALPTPQTATPE
ncbi:MAG TPA: VacJ family lipoprotein [Alphaproteobacteria bacterium]